MTSNEKTEEKENEAEEKTNLSHTILCADGKTKVISNYQRALAIKLFCVNCLGWEEHPKNCTDKFCPLYPFRGMTIKSNSSIDIERPPITEEQKERFKKNLEKANAKKKINANNKGN